MYWLSCGVRSALAVCDFISASAACSCASLSLWAVEIFRSLSFATLLLSDSSADFAAKPTMVRMSRAGPSDWQVELMYDGAVKAVIAMFQCNYAVRPSTDAFRRYILRALALGTVRSYFMREENDSVRAVANPATASSRKRPIRNKVEQDVITRELLRQVTNFPHLRAPLVETLRCISALGPDGALKEQAYPNLKRDRGRRPILDPDAIAEAMGTSRAAVHRHLREARLILREVFNADGKLFLTR